ncbi:MAG: DUF3301 domain-containing protein [Gammaproteobacteria bacterium]|jgi:hypothetical protein|uniref:DUF3301 domain-containing protein n=1 Tax=Pseudomonas TaxID=286 RepID=UPI000CBD6BC7|nr:MULTISPECIES: DUF3301 domain-containing protein [Pseudomonas]MDP2746459.1 DUF3301 domain-containing protein [Pseudomonas sp.]MDR7024107.1 hypothetical protein [Pseudomonas peli]PJE44031.1 MAG: DUF3301 domain-containing protein [Pseudomonas sp.] [Pseudomonas sp. FEMGT703P]
MIDLFDVFLLMLFATACAWLWHAHGLREHALGLVKQHCAKSDIELLDENVALRRLALLPDARGRKRLARVYGFEFTVTGEQRHVGSITLFGKQLGRIELAPHPFREPPAPSAQVIEMQQWRSQRQDSDNNTPH